MTWQGFRDAHQKLTPSWLRDETEGERLLWSLETLLDASLERVRQSVKARFPEHGPLDALSYHSRDRRIVRGLGELPEVFARRMLSWLDEHRVRGNPFALMRQLRAYCNAEVRVRVVDRRGNWYTLDRDGTTSYLLAQGDWDWDGGAASRWARFWVIIYPTAAGEPWTTGSQWGDPGLVWGDPTKTWGTSATPQQVADVRRIVRDWKPAGTRCEHIIIAFDDDSFQPGGVDLPDGTWGSARNRLDTARYWRGTRGE